MSQTVFVPGEVIATYDNGSITKLVFVPAAGAAGYFGPAAMVVGGTRDDLDVKSTDGPFWRAMQKFIGLRQAIRNDIAVIGWEE